MDKMNDKKITTKEFELTKKQDTIMKGKIQINKDDLIIMLVEKVNFMTKEYKQLHNAFTYDGKGRTMTDPIRVAESYQRFLGESGDIKRILRMYHMFCMEDINLTDNIHNDDEVEETIEEVED